MGLTKECYGTYIDKESINKVLGNRTIAIFAGTCAAALLACEAVRRLKAGAVLGAIEAGAVGGIPAAIAAVARGAIAGQLEWSGESVIESLTTYERPYALSGALAVGPADLIQAYKFNFEYAKKAAEYLLSTKTETGKLAEVKSAFGKITTKGASTRVNRYFNALFGEIEEPKNLDTLQKARIIAAAENPTTSPRYTRGKRRPGKSG